jgi:hypothetical protein
MSHTETDRSCEPYRAWALEAADGELAAAQQRELDLHTAGCEPCHTFALDVRQIRETAAKLPRMTPRADGWATIAARLKQEPVHTRHPLAFGSRRLLAVAAVLVVAVGLSVLLLRHPPAASNGTGTTASAGGQAGTTGPAVNASGGDLVQSVDEELRQAETHYDKAISGLEEIAKAGQSSLDPKIAETLQKNLGIMDQAIRDSRTALRSQPTSQLAQESLFEALRRKVTLLEDTIALINEMRKGNQAGAARVIRGLNKT